MRSLEIKDWESCCFGWGYASPACCFQMRFFPDKKKKMSLFAFLYIAAIQMYQYVQLRERKERCTITYLRLSEGLGMLS